MKRIAFPVHPTLNADGNWTHLQRHEDGRYALHNTTTGQTLQLDTGPTRDEALDVVLKLEMADV